MSDRPIIDAGPALNFLSINKERLLISVVGGLSAPEIVESEVLRKARSDARFTQAEAVWKKLVPGWLEILPDDVTPELAAAVQRISGMPMVDRTKRAQDLGETMVVAHAVVFAEAGADVTVIIDDGDGARIATVESRRLMRRRLQGHHVGSLTLVSTLTVLERAAGGEYLLDRAAMRATYEKLRERDDGLPPIENTALLSSELWRRVEPLDDSRA
jgi:hypothetical protein